LNPQECSDRCTVDPHIGRKNRHP